MLYFNDFLKTDVKSIDTSIDILGDAGDSDAVANYLYFLRDEINKRIKAENRKRKVKK